MSRTRSWWPPLLVVAVSLISGLAVSCSAGTTAAPPPSLAKAQQQLFTHTNGMASVMVAVPGGYEAALYDQYGHISFWRDVGSWQAEGRLMYPRDLGEGTNKAICGAPGVAVTGSLLPGAQHAAYIVCGQFSGDGSGWDVIFTQGS